MNPLDILYCWQAVLVACAATGMTQLVKVIIDVARGHYNAAPTPTFKDKAAIGKELRKGDAVLNRIVFPALPILFGVLCAIVVPARPDSITEFITAKAITGTGAMLIYASWGGACGQFADYIFSKVKSVMEALAARPRRSTPPPGDDAAPAS